MKVLILSLLISTSAFAIGPLNPRVKASPGPFDACYKSGSVYNCCPLAWKIVGGKCVSEYPQPQPSAVPTAQADISTKAAALQAAQQKGAPVGPAQKVQQVGK